MSSRRCAARMASWSAPMAGRAAPPASSTGCITASSIPRAISSPARSIPASACRNGCRRTDAPAAREDSMKELLKQYLDAGISRRKLMSGLTAAGVTSVAAKAMAQSLTPFAGSGAAVPANAMREMSGTGGALFVAQLKAAGIEYIFFNPSTGDHPIFDALVDEPGIQCIKGVQEGAVVAMADGYARASGKLGMVIVADIGPPHATTQMA